ncbi:uncharacterized protein ths isoform X2 [Venturia canescens]|uniref:uncharacterized protein ths isoform X2 n=1 Tax=Venturia canescens TaxID=32260 RepID=UPI001C9C0707|nr:uncharacterized protein LOC122406235 isoform X2 [Venturia canescens]
MTEIARLPQLAVLAKILCLLMVVMCGAMPAMVRSVSLYSTCSSNNVTVIGRTVKTMTKADQIAPYQLLTTQSEDFSGKLYIYAEKTQRYICFNKRWKPVALLKKQRDAMCQFYESYNGAFFRYRSAVDSSYMLGFNKLGKAIRNRRGRPECFNFLKYNPNMEERLERHNDLVSGRTGANKNGGKGSSNANGGNAGPRHGGSTSRREMLQHARKHLQQPASTSSHNQQHKAKKILFQADEVPRETMTMSMPHRHRHSNRLKQPHEDVTSPRRRHHQSRLLEASKY